MRSLLLSSVAITLAVGLAACKPTASTPATAATAPPVAPVAAAATPANAPAPTTAAAAANTFTGAITETMSSGGYTYAHLKEGADDVWVAAPEFDAKVGERISASLQMPMRDFESKTLKRTFPLLYFVADVSRNGGALVGQQQPAPPSLMASHGAAEAAAPPTIVRMDPPAGGLAVSAVFAKRDALAGKSVTVRGTVVKYNGGILDCNWLHIQDGSGSADAHDNDLTITSDGTARVGDVVTATGIVGINKDFGAGYAYVAMLEKASLK